MSSRTAAQKLGIKPGATVYPINAPDDHPRMLGELPPDAHVVRRATPAPDVVLVFVRTAADVARYAAAAFRAVKPGGLVGISYPKGGKAALNRDSLWAQVQPMGWAGVTLVALDNTWSAMRFRPAGEVGR